MKENEIALAFCDVSTGDFYTTEFKYNINVIIDELCKFNPREIIITESFSKEIIDEITIEHPFIYLTSKMIILI